LALDPDRLGMLGGALLASTVLTVGLFVRGAEITESVIRAGVVFAVGYAAVFVLVYVIRRIVDAETARIREAERQANASKNKESEATRGGTE
jgi:uncharacterized membrane protein